LVDFDFSKQKLYFAAAATISIFLVLVVDELHLK
jgi:hypothetical protein